MSIPATLKNILQLEISRPLNNDLVELIEDSFKEQYVKPVKAWALVHNDHKRKQLMKLMNGSVVSKQFLRNSVRKSAPLFSAKSNPEFVMRTPNASINLNACFSPRSPRKRIFQNSYRSQIREEGIFGSEIRKREAPHKETSDDSFIEYKIKKLFKPKAAERLLSNASVNLEFINEIQNWVDNEAQRYPYDTNPPSPRLTPRVQARLFHDTMSEDHMEKNTYVPTKPGTPRVKRPTNADSHKHTTYNDFYSIDARQGALPSLSKPFLPTPHTQPFSSMPLVEGRQYKYTNEMIKDQINKNKGAFIAYKNLSYAKTML